MLQVLHILFRVVYIHFKRNIWSVPYRNIFTADSLRSYKTCSKRIKTKKKNTYVHTYMYTCVWNIRYSKRKWTTAPRRYFVFKSDNSFYEFYLRLRTPTFGLCAGFLKPIQKRIECIGWRNSSCSMTNRSVTIQTVICWHYDMRGGGRRSFPKHTRFSLKNGIWIRFKRNTTCCCPFVCKFNTNTILKS